MLIKPNGFNFGEALLHLLKHFYLQDGVLTVQSGELLYERFTAFLKRLGRCPNPARKCVWNLLRNEKQITLGFHVDENLVTSKNTADLDFF